MQIETQTQKIFQNLEQELLNLKFQSGMERVILNHWREYEPKKVQALLSKGTLKQALTHMADALWDLQMSLEENEKLNPVLAQAEAWNRLMRIEEDEAEEAAAFGMTLEEYRNRP